MAISGTFEKLAILANVSGLALYFGCALAAWRLRQLGVAEQGTAIRVTSGFDIRDSTFASAQVPLGAVAPWLACMVIVWLLTGLTRDEWLAFGACLAAASVLYAITRAMRQGT